MDKLIKIWKCENGVVEVVSNILDVAMEDFDCTCEVTDGYFITKEQLEDLIEDSYRECIEEQPIHEAKKQILKELGVE